VSVHTGDFHARNKLAGSGDYGTRKGSAPNGAEDHGGIEEVKLGHGLGEVVRVGVKNLRMWFIASRRCNN